MSEQRAAKPAKLILYVLAAGLLAAALAFPIVGGAGAVANRLSDVAAQDSALSLGRSGPHRLNDGRLCGKPDRVDFHAGLGGSCLPGNRIADTMKLAIVSIEDKRFGQHNGVDVPGSLTGLAGYLQGAVDTRGGSTIEQQYVKNFNLLVNAQTDADRRAAIATTPARKLRESGRLWNSTKCSPRRRS